MITIAQYITMQNKVTVCSCAINLKYSVRIFPDFCTSSEDSRGKKILHPNTSLVQPFKVFSLLQNQTKVAKLTFILTF